MKKYTPYKKRLIFLRKFRTMTAVFTLVLGMIMLAVAIVIPPKPTAIGFVVTFVWLVSLFLSFGLQFVIVILVGKPSEEELKKYEESLPIHNYDPAKKRKDLICEDDFGANANKRSFIIGLFWAIMFCLFIFTDPKGSLGFMAILVVITYYWSIFYKYSKIVFLVEGIKLESAGFVTWGQGRQRFIPYHELEVRQPKGYVGDSISFYQRGKFVYSVNGKFWNDIYRSMCSELTYRLPTEQVKFFIRYPN